MKPAVTPHSRFYRQLLALYPAEFRARHGEDMAQLFEDQLRDARHDGAPASVARTWLRTLGDLAVTAASVRARRDRRVAHSLSAAPSGWTRALGLVGIVGGVVLMAAFLPNIRWSSEFFNLRLVLFNAGAIAIVVAVHRRQAGGSGRASVAVALAAILANAWYLAMVVLSIGRPQPPEGDPDFRLVMFFAGAAMWWADSAFGLVTLRLGMVSRSGALALMIGSVLAFTGMDRLELLQGDFAWLFSPAALAGIALNGIGWILIGLDLAVRHRRLAVPERDG